MTVDILFLFSVDSLGLEPKLQESKSCVLTNYTMNQVLENPCLIYTCQGLKALLLPAVFPLLDFSEC